ncbi:uncharacterized protein LOC106086655 [Stomoxys calcitrans]|uniref:uncharacterized protein LOC106086655 n=1 Tax=Stomoxys calcitrans TaxID=35570 RepID=UPI0027E382FD|nr:uncharacterized protein LOC106086655 [Stomoxys calcitrans]
MKLFLKFLFLACLLANLQLHKANAVANVEELSQVALPNLCEQPGDLCSLRCQILGGRDGRCNKAKMCYCNPL